jgi:hypothetical protein
MKRLPLQAGIPAADLGDKVRTMSWRPDKFFAKVQSSFWAVG